VQNLSVGAKLWGAVQEVSHKRLVVSLPNGLRGFVAPEDASDVLRSLLTPDPSKQDKRLRALLHNSAPSLADLFYPGQLVRAAVCKLDAGSNQTDTATGEAKVCILFYSSKDLLAFPGDWSCHCL
jgi:rRNA biogenesis protein RRP5